MTDNELMTALWDAAFQNHLATTGHQSIEHATAMTQQYCTVCFHLERAKAELDRRAVES